MSWLDSLQGTLGSVSSVLGQVGSIANSVTHPQVQVNTQVEPGSNTKMIMWAAIGVAVLFLLGRKR